jgi:hypothetical protein
VFGKAKIALGQLTVKGRTWPGGKEPQIRWPVGPHYKELAASDERSWVDYKLASADWYLAALRRLQPHGRPLDRYLGVEMAIDGVLAAQSSAIDAAVETLIRALERHLANRAIGVPRTIAKRLWKADWSVVANLAQLDPTVKLHSSVLAQAALVDEPGALKAIAPSVREMLVLDQLGGSRSTRQVRRREQLTHEIEQVKVGIVAEIRWLRNAMTHHNSHNRAFGSEVAPVALFSPLRIQKEPLGYLTQGLVEVRALAESILADAAALAP